MEVGEVVKASGEVLATVEDAGVDEAVVGIGVVPVVPDTEASMGNISIKTSLH